jgi:quinol monooxygenase YgiN
MRTKLAWIGWVAFLCSSSAYAEEKKMTVEYIRYEIPAEQADAFVKAYRDAGAQLRASTHCLRYEVTRGVEEPEHFTVRIEWDSVDGHERGFRSSPEFRAFFAAVKPFFGNIREMKHYQVIESGTGGHK